MIVETHVASVVQETPIDRTLRLGVPPEARDAFAFTPGQFVVLHDPREAKPRRRAYSISSPPCDEPFLEITVRDMGTFGHTLYGMPAGSRIMMRAPAGRFVLQEEDGDHVLMAAGGSGVTPFRAFVGSMHARAAGTACTLVQSARVPAELVFHDTFHAWSHAHHPFTYVPTVTRAAADDPWPGARGRIDARLLAPHVRDPARTRFYACGPEAFVQAMLALADALHIPSARQHKEQWG